MLRNKPRGVPRVTTGGWSVASCVFCSPVVGGRNAPPVYGPPQELYSRTRHGAPIGMRRAVLKALAADWGADGSTYVKAHRSAIGGRGGRTTRRSARTGAAATPKFMPLLARKADRSPSCSRLSKRRTAWLPSICLQAFPGAATSVPSALTTATAPAIWSLNRGGPEHHARHSVVGQGAASGRPSTRIAPPLSASFAALGTPVATVRYDKPPSISSSISASSQHHWRSSVLPIHRWSRPGL